MFSPSSLAAAPQRWLFATFAPVRRFTDRSILGGRPHRGRHTHWLPWAEQPSLYRLRGCAAGASFSPPSRDGPAPWRSPTRSRPFNPACSWPARLPCSGCSPRAGSTGRDGHGHGSVKSCAGYGRCSRPTACPCSPSAIAPGCGTPLRCRSSPPRTSRPPSMKRKLAPRDV
jgi:hypothetical protein